MIRGAPGNLRFLRQKYLQATGAEWPGTNHHLRTITRSSSKIDEVIAKMVSSDSTELPDDPKLRPLGHVTDLELRQEIAKRPELWARMRTR